MHVAIIMDGNGRWAARRGLARAAGHRAGAAAVRRVVEVAPGCGVDVLTLYAFSADNWKRPRREVNSLMWLFRRHLRAEAGRCVENGIRLSVVGRRDRLPRGLVAAIRDAEDATAAGSGMALRIAVDYSARDAICRAAALWARDEVPSREDMSRLVAAACGAGDAPDVDLLVRTGGERRLSDFLLWESAYAELVFTDRMWPDFDKDDLRDAMCVFHGRERRFGSLPEVAPDRESRAAAAVPA